MHNQEKKALMRFVEELPTQTNCAGYDDAVPKMAARYGATTQDLRMLLEQYHEFFREGVTTLLSQRYSERGDVEFDDFTAILERVVKSVLLRMWCYGNEHSTRYSFPQLLENFNAEMDQLINPPREK